MQSFPGEEIRDNGGTRRLRHAAPRFTESPVIKPRVLDPGCSSILSWLQPRGWRVLSFLQLQQQNHLCLFWSRLSCCWFHPYTSWQTWSKDTICSLAAWAAQRSSLGMCNCVIWNKVTLSEPNSLFRLISVLHTLGMNLYSISRPGLKLLWSYFSRFFFAKPWIKKGWSPSAVKMQHFCSIFPKDSKENSLGLEAGLEKGDRVKTRSI